MAEHQEQEYQPVFDIENKYVVKGWEKVNPKNKKPTVPIEKVQVFLKYVFEESKDELEIDLQEDTDYIQMVLDFMQEHSMAGKKTFTFQEALDVLNWAVDPGEDEEEEKQQVQEQQPQVKSLSKVQQHKKQVQKSQYPQKAEKPSKKEKKNIEQKPHVEKGQEPEEQLKQDAQQHENSEHEQNHEENEQHHDKQQHHQKTHEEHEKNRAEEEQHDDEKNEQHQEQHQKHSKHQSQKIQPKKDLPHKDRHNNEDEHDWGKVDKSHDNISKQLYKQMNSYQEISHPEKEIHSKVIEKQVEFGQTLQQQVTDENQNTSRVHNQKHYYNQPLSIKKSLAKLNRTKVKHNSKHIPPVLKLYPTAPEMKYLKKQKIIIKNKKTKPQYHPEHTGLKELFKFYCGLNSEFYSMSKHRDPSKGTFDEFESRSANLYMHNFMLLCKDFNIAENKMTSKATLKNSIKTIDQIKQKQSESKNNNAKVESTVKRRSSKGLVPESTGVSVQINQSSLQVEIGQKEKSSSKVSKQRVQAKQFWDRDKLSNYFKKEADYTLNVKFDKFFQIMKVVLKERLVIEVQEKPESTKGQSVEEKVHKKQSQIEKKSVHNSESAISQGQVSKEEQPQQPREQEPEKESNQKIEQKQPTQKVPQEKKLQQIDPLILAICQFFKLDTQENFEQTFSKLRVLYKIASSEPAPRKQKTNKSTLQQNGHFHQDIDEMLKVRQMEKQQQRYHVKEKYLNKYSVPEIDVYSSFKGATNQVNTLNSLYGSAPKLVPNKSGKCSTVSEGTFGANTIEYDMKKKHSGEYKINIKNIIKDARNEIMETNKENRPSHRVKEHSNTQNLAKSRLNCVNSSQNSQKPMLGYKKLHDLRQLQEETLSSILLNNSRLLEGGNTNRSQKPKQKSKDISSPLLQRMGCHEDDDLLNKYFDQEKEFEKSNVKVGAYMR